jgi:hypothetical protein
MLLKMKSNGTLDRGRLIIYMDGAAYHCSRLADAIYQEFDVRVLIGHPQSPEFNPAEWYIKYHKAIIGKQLRTGR